MTATVSLTVTHPLRLSVLLLSAFVIGIGCDRNESAIRTYTAPKDQPAAVEASGPIHWTVPEGWKQLPGSSEMRYATFDVSADQNAQLTVVPLPPEAAAVLPNINRWAGQLKLPSVSEADFSKYVQPTQVSGESATLVDMTGSAESGNPPTRLLAAIVPHEGRSWFFTLKAPEPVVAGQKQKFEQFVHSIQFPAGETADASTTPSPDAAPPDSAGPPAAADPSVGQSFKLAKWKTPEGWIEQPGSNAMRVTSFRVGSGADSAEVVVSKIAQGQTGSFVDNINRWRGQVGLEPVADQKPGDMQPITMAGHQALLLSLTGPRQSDVARQILVAIDIEGRDFWFVKLLGAEKAVASQQDNFRQFLDSLQFEAESK